jgi:hypothetical protein
MRDFHGHFKKKIRQLYVSGALLAVDRCKNGHQICICVLTLECLTHKCLKGSNWTSPCTKTCI